MTGPGADAFAVLGLPRDVDLSDAQVRQAYRERLRAVHPDAGGDGECAAAVTAAYDALRSPVRRAAAAEAVMLAADGGSVQGPGVSVGPAALLERIEDLASARELVPGRGIAREFARAVAERAGAPAGAGAPLEAAPSPERVARGGLGAFLARVRYGRWWLLAVRVVAAVVVLVAAWLVAPGYPAAWAALAVGSVTWLLLTGRYDLAPGPPR